eukprot:COSAG02_NODE_10868_length_1842_cov_1.671256_1_plen_62_part_00
MGQKKFVSFIEQRQANLDVGRALGKGVGTLRARRLWSEPQATTKSKRDSPEIPKHEPQLSH